MLLIVVVNVRLISIFIWFLLKNIIGLVGKENSFNVLFNFEFFLYFIVEIE